jgi:hypothetical protein
VAGWDWTDESCAMKVALAVGKDLQAEIEMARLRHPDKIDYNRVMKAQNRHLALSPYRTLEWSNRVTVHAGWWLLKCAEACDLFESEQRQVGRNVLTLPKIADCHWEEIKKLREELSLARPYYLPHQAPAGLDLLAHGIRPGSDARDFCSRRPPGHSRGNQGGL